LSGFRSEVEAILSGLGRIPLRISELAVVLSVVAFGIGAGPASAADRKVSAQELVKQGFFSDFDELDLSSLLEGTEVTAAIAARRPEPLGMASGAVTVVTADDIRSFGFLTLEDLLRTIPGFDILVDNLGHPRIVSRGIAPGVRGSSEGVLIMINGHPLNEDVSGGATAINYTIPISTAHHVEVLRGAASGLYGDGALTAVVNIVTDGNTEKDRQNGLAFSAGFGSMSQDHATMEIGSKIGEVWVGGSADFYNTSGADALVSADAQTRRDAVSTLPPISQAPGHTRDDIRSLETVYRVLYKDWKFLWRVKQEKSGGYIGSTDTLGATGNQVSDRQMLLGAAYEHKVQGGMLDVHLDYTDGHSDEFVEIIPPGFLRDLGNGFIAKFPSIIVQTGLGSRRVALEGTYSKTLFHGHDLSAGLSVARESTTDETALSNLVLPSFVAVGDLKPLDGFPSAARGRLGLWVSDAWRAPWQITATGALRFDEVGNQGGGHLSPRLALIRPLPHDLMARLVYSSAFQAPSFRDLYFSIPGYAPNPDLAPTTLDQAELSLTYRKGDLQVAGTTYLGWLHDPVVPAGALSLARPPKMVNGADVHVRGFELTARRSLGENSVWLSYALQSPRYADTDVRVADVPTHMATFGATFMVAGTYAISPTLILRSDRPRDPLDSRPALDGHVEFGATARHSILSKKLELRAVLEDLFNETYLDPSPYYGVPGDYPRAGRSVFIDAKYRF
jgi:iron complex outermembrane receptor protein